MQPQVQQEQQVPAQQRPRVCRRLFVDEDDEMDPRDVGARDNVLNQINEEINRDLDDACKKYNFDFRAEAPLAGDWVWERVQAQPSEQRPSAPAPDNLELPPAEPQEADSPADPPATSVDA